jgi:aspartate aminotransferase
MTGWRVGYLAGPSPVIEAISQVSASSTFTPCSITQAAAVEALTGSQELVAERCQIYKRRRDIVFDGISRIPELTIVKPQGAFYAFPGCAGLLGRKTPEGKTITSDLDVALHLLESEGLAVVNGTASGTPGYIRLAFATSDVILLDAIRRLRSACAKLV